MKTKKQKKISQIAACEIKQNRERREFSLRRHFRTTFIFEKSTSQKLALYTFCFGVTKSISPKYFQNDENV